ncbi:hypothetical protein AVEN_179235-1 [Araneus ventricosus]|uniref:PiggyBac transposable element-derived protein domain-containing protein n=1 Tax=Araneus ventricosus TaxID=182803 RepID=A0A4Y2C974_ARAVE|nr:hypothetical protein AVEN_179235-1 [Araneus ventricosus]
MEIYAGTQPDGPYKLDNCASEIVMRLMQKLHNSRHNVIVDNWCTSYPLSQKLLEKKLTVVGTIRKNKRELPLEFVGTKGKAPHSSILGFQKGMTIVSYIPKKNRSIVLLSTLHNNDNIDESAGEFRKPEIIYTIKIRSMYLSNVWLSSRESLNPETSQKYQKIGNNPRNPFQPFKF